MTKLMLLMMAGNKFGAQTNSLMNTIPEFSCVRDELYKLNAPNTNESFFNELETIINVKFSGPFLTGSQELLVERAVFNWIKMILWVTQRNTELSRGKHPFNTPDFKAAEPGGIYLDSILKLCKIILDYAEDFGVHVDENSDNCYGWWRSICIELEFCVLSSFLFFPGQPIPQLTIAPFRGLTSKAKIAQAVREESAQLDEWENPYPKTFPNFYNLISACLFLDKCPSSTKTDVARREFKAAWRNYKDAYRQFGEKIRENPDISILQQKDGKLYRQVRRQPGKPAVKLIYPEPPKKSELKISRSKRKQIVS